MNAARQIISRRFVSAGPRLTGPARYASTHAVHHGPSPQDSSVMRGVFTAGTMAVGGGVVYGATRSGGRIGNRYSKKNSTLDSSKWFAEGSDINHFFGSKH
ncbi:hypothetical protein H2200_007735 [Cladophialophora chaetospira]|uniref:Uncharacterized protein n=1 Tax=Cladophialophora chaetospira TaxID=386627 RepID=A0AA38X6B6_9EURO|nr:hypothetical protein H2200_007735 [Cladophialophora chaetospira]